MGYPPLKHVLDDLFSIAPATTATQVVTLAVGTINPNYIGTNNQVRNGSLVTKLTILLDIGPTANTPLDADGSLFYDWYIAFNIAGAQALPNPNAVGGSVLAPQVFHQDQGMFDFTNSGTVVSYPAAHVIRVEVNVPKSWQRLNDTDTIELRFQKSAMISQTLNVKLKCIYKEIFP